MLRDIWMAPKNKTVFLKQELVTLQINSRQLNHL